MFQYGRRKHRGGLDRERAGLRLRPTLSVATLEGAFLERPDSVCLSSAASEDNPGIQINHTEEMEPTSYGRRQAPLKWRVDCRDQEGGHSIMTQAPLLRTYVSEHSDGTSEPYSVYVWGHVWGAGMGNLGPPGITRAATRTTLSRSTIGNGKTISGPRFL